VLEAPLSLRRDMPTLAPRQPVPRSESAGETERTPNAGASNPPPDLPDFIRSTRNPVMNLRTAVGTATHTKSTRAADGERFTQRLKVLVGFVPSSFAYSAYFAV
jgi:hypothetical protein